MQILVLRLVRTATAAMNNRRSFSVQHNNFIKLNIDLKHFHFFARSLIEAQKGSWFSYCFMKNEKQKSAILCIISFIFH
jgi:hypothetical protein